MTLSVTDKIRAIQEWGGVKITPPSSRGHLAAFADMVFNLHVPGVSVCPEHSSPMDYLWHGFSADAATDRLNSDAVIWACRGGSKTLLGGLLSVLDCLFKPGIEIRILGGSLEQSSRMYAYVRRFAQSRFENRLAGPVLKHGCGFTNGSRIEVLAQSARSVRGSHVHKLRCDEVELFDPDVYAAAQFITRGTGSIRPGLEAASTMHRPYGLMQDVVETARINAVPVFKWCVWEVIEKCVHRSCSRCALNAYCRTKAQRADGYMRIDDVITQMRRGSRAGFESEMLCLRPNLDNAVFAEFDPQVHVRPVETDPNLPLYRAVDFGFVNPFVCLFIQVDAEGNVRVVDEYARTRRTIAEHVREILRRTGRDESRVAGTFCDPAGSGPNDVTGTSAVREMRARGMNMQYRRSLILEGIEEVRRAIRAGDGSTRLVISPRCAGLIEALRCYHYPPARAQSEQPVKDGIHDHFIDALRYFFVNRAAARSPHTRRY